MMSKLLNRVELEKALNEILLNKLDIDSGIYEFYENKEMSIGISYEHNEDGNKVYIFNVFVCGEYINVDGEYKTIYDGIPELLKVWNETNKLFGKQ